MLSSDTPSARLWDTLFGVLIFIAIIAGGTYYLQSSLILVRKYDAYTHWAIILLVLPVIAGLALRLARIYYPLICSLLGVLVSTALLYPKYKAFWAHPPSTVDMLVYAAIVLGISYLSSQPLKTTFMMAFRLGRFSVSSFTVGNGKKPVRRESLTKSQRLQPVGHVNTIAMLELVVGFTSLALSIFSIFFLGKA